MQPSPLLARSAASTAAQIQIRPAFRSPKRVTITLPFATFQDLQEKADGEGRSLSNLAAFLLESSLRVEGEPSSKTADRHQTSKAFR